MQEPQRIVIPLSDGLSIVAERGNDPNYPRELFIGIVRDDGVWYQDLAIVRNAYHYDDDSYDVVYDDDKFEVLVYADENDEDYTDRFEIDLYHGGI